MLDNLRRMAKLQGLFGSENFPAQQEPNLGTNVGLPPLAMNMAPIETSPFEHAASDRINPLLDAMPQREDPSMLRRLGSMVVGIGQGPEAQQGFLNKPHDQAMQDWSAQWKPTMDAANQERFSNANERQLLALKETTRKNTETEDARNRKLDEDERRHKSDEELRTFRAKAYDYKTRHPNSVFKEDKDGNIMAIDPQTNSVEYLTDDLGNKIHSSKLPEADKINLQLKGRLEAIAAQGDQSRKTKATVSGSSGPKAETPNQTKIRQYLSAREYYNTHPEMQKYIKLGDPGTNDFELVGPGTSGFGYIKTGPEATKYEEMKKAIYGEVPPMAVNHDTTTPPKGKVQPSKLAKPKAPAAPKGRVNIFKDGQHIGSIPDTPGQLQQAKDAGYEVG